MLPDEGKVANRAKELSARLGTLATNEGNYSGGVGAEDASVEWSGAWARRRKARESLTDDVEGELFEG